MARTDVIATRQLANVETGDFIQEYGSWYLVRRNRGTNDNGHFVLVVVDTGGASYVREMAKTEINAAEHGTIPGPFKPAALRRKAKTKREKADQLNRQADAIDQLARCVSSTPEEPRAHNEHHEPGGFEQ